MYIEDALKDWINNYPRENRVNGEYTQHFDYLNIDFNGRLRDYKDWPSWIHTEGRVRVIVVM